MKPVIKINPTFNGKFLVSITINNRSLLDVQYKSLEEVEKDVETLKEKAQSLFVQITALEKSLNN